MHAHADPTSGMVFAAAAHVLEADAAAAPAAADAGEVLRRMDRLAKAAAKRAAKKARKKSGDYSATHPSDGSSSETTDDDDDEEDELAGGAASSDSPQYLESRNFRRQKKWDRARTKAAAKAAKAGGGGGGVGGRPTSAEDEEFDPNDPNDVDARKKMLRRKRKARKQARGGIEGGWDNFMFGPEYDEMGAGLTLDASDPRHAAAIAHPGRRLEGILQVCMAACRWHTNKQTSIQTR